MITIEIEPSGNLFVTFFYDYATVERIKQIRGATWVKSKKRWEFPVTALDKLIKEFGDVCSISPDAFMEATAKTPAMVVAETLHQAGITLTEIDGRLVGFGGCYCPDPWQKLIDAHADQLRRLPVEESEPDIAHQRAPVDLSQLTEIDKALAQGWDSWVKQEHRKAEMIERRQNAWKYR